MSTPIGRRPVPVLVFGAAILRLAILRRGVGTPTSTEQLLANAAATGESLGVPAGAFSKPWMALLSVLDRFTGEPAVTFANAPDLAGDPDPLIRAAHILAAVLGVWAVGLVAGGTQRMAGTRAAWLAGGLIALSPLALRQCSSAGPGSFHLLVAAGFLYAVSHLRRGASPVVHLLAGAWGGLAFAAGGGAAGLLPGLFFVGLSLPGWGAAAVIAGVLAPGTFVALFGLPPGGALAPIGSAPPPAASPLISGLLTLVGAIGGPALALAILGKIGVLRAGVESVRGARAAVFATAGAFLVALLRFGAEPALLTATLPGLAVLAGLALAALSSPEHSTGTRPAAWLLPALMGVTLTGPVIGAVPVLSAHLRPHPPDQIADWMHANAPDGAVILSEKRILPVPTAAGVKQMTALVDSGAVSSDRASRYFGGGDTFSILPLPPNAPDPLDRALLYDPALAEAFPYLVLLDLPDQETSREPIELTAARRLFHEYFRAAWVEVGRFGSEAVGDEILTLYQRPPDFELDREALARLGRILTANTLVEQREKSHVFTEWAAEAGHALLVAGDIDAARSYLGMVTERDPESVEGRYQFARVLTLQGELEQAKSELLAGMSRDPYHGGIHLHLGALLEEEGDAAGALIEYQAAVMNLEDPSPARARLGVLFQRLGHTEAARDQLRELEATAPDADVTKALRALLSVPSSAS